MSDVLLSDLSLQLERLFADRQYAAGFALGRHILQSYPRHLFTYKQMGLAALEAGMVEDSVDLLQRALSADPEDGEMWAALHDAATRLDIHPDAEVAGVYASDLLQLREGKTPIARGHLAAREKDWATAYKEYREGYQTNPERMDAGLGLLTSLFFLKEWQASLTVARHILAEIPYCLKALWFAAISMDMLDRQGAASERWLNLARSIDPDDVQIMRWVGRAPAEKFQHSLATIPAWDDSETWSYIASASESDTEEFL